MTAKEYLLQIRVLNVEVKQLQEQLGEIRIKAAGASAIRYDVDKVQTSPKDPMPEFLVKCFELEERIQRKIAERQELKNRILEQIHSLNNARYEEILYLRYVRGDTARLTPWPQVSHEMGYKDTKYALREHGRALSEFAKKVCMGD